MRKEWLGICIAAGMLAACTNDDGQQQTTVPQPAVCNGPIVEISGAEPRFESPIATANQIISATVRAIKSFRTLHALVRPVWRQYTIQNQVAI